MYSLYTKVSGRAWFPDHLAKVRENSIKLIRPFLEHVNIAIGKLNTNPSKAANVKLLQELKQIAINFLVTSEAELERGVCKTLITDIQNLKKKFPLNLNPDSIELELMIKLLFILSTYSRVQEYIKDVSSYMVHASSTTTYLW